MAAAVGKVENNALGLSSKNKTKGRRRNARKFTKKNKIMEQIKKQIKNVKKSAKSSIIIWCVIIIRETMGVGLKVAI